MSCRFDGAVSQFEIALAGAHLRSCADCAAFEADVGAFTEFLRLADPEHSSRSFHLPSRVRYRRPLVMVRAVAASAAVAIAAVGIGGSAQFDSSSTSLSSAAPVSGEVRLEGLSDADVLASTRELNRQSLADGTLPVLPVSDDTIGAIKPILPAR